MSLDSLIWLHLGLIHHNWSIRCLRNPHKSTWLKTVQKSKSAYSDFWQTSNQSLVFICGRNQVRVVNFGSLAACLLISKRKFGFGVDLVVEICVWSCLVDWKIPCIRFLQDFTWPQIAQIWALGYDFCLFWKPFK